MAKGKKEMTTNIDALKRNKIHRSFAPIFEKTIDDGVFNSLTKAFHLYQQNKSILQKELDFSHYFKNFDSINNTTVQQFNSAVIIFLTEYKTNHYIKRAIPLKKRKYFYSNHKNLELLKEVVNLVDLTVFKKYFSNSFSHESAENVERFLVAILNDLKIDYHKEIQNYYWKERSNDHVVFINNDNALIYPDDNINTFFKLGSRYWCCSVKSDSILYSFNLFERVYIYHDFTLEKHHHLSCVALLVDTNHQIIDIFDKYNFELKDKETIAFYQAILDKETLSSENTIHKELGLLNQAIYNFKNKKEVPFLTDLKKHNRSLHTGELKAFHYLMPKILETFSLEDIERLFKWMKYSKSSLTTFIKTPHGGRLRTILDFENIAFSHASTRIFLNYVKENSESTFLSDENRFKIINNLSELKVLDSNIIFEFSLFNNYFSANDTERKEVESYICQFIEDIYKMKSSKEIEEILEKNFEATSNNFGSEHLLSCYIVIFKYFEMIHSKEINLANMEKVFDLSKKILIDNPCRDATAFVESIECKIVSLMYKFIAREDTEFLNAYSLFLVKSGLEQKHRFLSEIKLYFSIDALKEDKYFNKTFTEQLKGLLIFHFESNPINKKVLKNNLSLKHIIKNSFSYFDKEEIDFILEKLTSKRTVNAIKDCIRYEKMR